jgi:hypothetical protein
MGNLGSAMPADNGPTGSGEANAPDGTVVPTGVANTTPGTTPTTRYVLQKLVLVLLSQNIEIY